MENVHDWCISRQLWWGHQIPAWYCDECGHINVSRRTREVREVRLHAPDARPGRAGHLVLLGALAVLHARLAGGHEDLAYFYPTSAMVTGYDIIFFWVARMIFSGWSR
jgi:valyl-tRNA synthetase